MNAKSYASIALFALTVTLYAYGRSLHGGAPSTNALSPSSTMTTASSTRSRPPATPSLAVPLTIYNTSGSTISRVPVSYEQPFAPGDVPANYHAVVYSGATPVVTQQDTCSSWTADGSCKSGQLSFVAPRILGSSNALFTLHVVAGPPSNNANITTAQAIANTNFCVKTADLRQADGTAEAAGVYSLCLSWVVANCREFSNSGYGKKPACGWEYYSKGPVKIGIHAWQFLRRESDDAIHKWIRGDLWVDMRGSGTTPCPCSVAYQLAQPNQFGPVAAGAVGPTTETAYVFSTTLYNGSNVIANQGGASDSRTGTVANAKFTAATDMIDMTGTWIANVGGIFPIRLTCATSCPTGLTDGHIYWIGTTGAVTTFKLYEHQCDLTGGSGNCTTPAIDFTSTGSGTITMTPYVFTNPYTGFLGLDTDANRFWISAAGTATTAPPTLIGHDFAYLTQKTKATPPYITALNNNLRTYAAGGQDKISDYYPGSYFFGWNMNATGDAPGDERVSYINHTGTYALFNPGDVGAAKKSRVIAAGFSRVNMYNIDERSGLPMVYNNGPAKNGVTYAAMGAVNPGVRTYPYLGGSLMHPYASAYDHDSFYWGYGVRLDGSHLPAPWQSAFLKTGGPEWLFQAEQEANAFIGQGYLGSKVIGGKTYYRPVASNEQTRGTAWGLRAVAQVNHFARDTDPAKPYFRDLLTDNAAFLVASNVGTAYNSRYAQALGYYIWDIPSSGNGRFQFWQNDFLWLVSSMEQWRGEIANFATFNGYLQKLVIGRMDTVGGGCLWAAPSREIYAFSSNVPGDYPNLFQTFSAMFSANYTFQASRGNSGWNPTYGAPASWTGCPSSGILMDAGGSSASQPSSLVTFAAMSAAMGDLNGVTRSGSIYSDIRAIQYGGTCYGCSGAMSFINYQYQNGYYISIPEFAIGPLGATQ